MKNKLTLIVIAICLNLVSYGQTEKEFNSTIKKVTVFTRGAQVEREASVALQKGQTALKLTGLSPCIKPESIRIDGDGSFTILNVQHQTDYLNELDKSAEIESVIEKIEDVQIKLEDEEVRLKIINDKLDFLNTNKNITGSEQTVEPEAYIALNSIYGNNLESLSLDALRRKRLIKTYNKEIIKLNKQLVSLNSKSDLPSGTLLIKVECTHPLNTEIRFNYLVDNVGWFPSYDMRFLGVNKPLNITYKANIRQNTGVDWKDVDLVLSTTKTNISAQIPKFSPFYLQFYYPEIEQALQGRVAGVQITGNSGTPGANSEIYIRGQSSANSLNEPLYVVDGVPQKSISNINPNEIKNIEVLKDASATAIYGTRGANGVVVLSTKQNSNETSIPFTLVSKHEISREYIVDAAQTIYANNKTTTVSYRKTNLDAHFEYQSIPKVSGNVFLVGKISDWYSAELLDGDVNVYLENSYVGKSRIDTRQFADTLEISFGIDNNISIKRERISEYSENQFIGSNRKETIAYKLKIRNNKTYAITTKITDQVPVSIIKDIEVEVLELSGGKMNKESGKIEWEVSLEPLENKDVIIKYSVKYPKEKRVLIE